MKRLLNLFVNSLNLKYILNFIRDIENVPITLIVKELVRQGNFEIINAISIMFNNIPVKKVIKGLSSKYNGDIIKNIKNNENASISTRKNLVIDTGNAELIYYFIRNYFNELSTMDLDELAMALSKIDNAYNIYLTIVNYGKYISTNTIDYLIDALIRIDDLKFIMYLFKYTELMETDKISRDSVNKLCIAVLKNNNNKEYIENYNLFDHISNINNTLSNMLNKKLNYTNKISYIDMKVLEDVVVESKDAELIYIFTYYFEKLYNINIERLEDALCKSKLDDNNFCIAKFAKNFEGLI